MSKRRMVESKDLQDMEELKEAVNILMKLSLWSAQQVHAAVRRWIRLQRHVLCRQPEPAAMGLPSEHGHGRGDEDEYNHFM